MKKFLVIALLLMVSGAMLAQNSLRSEGVTAAVTINGNPLAATSGTSAILTVPGEADWSLQIIPQAGAVLTPDSTYATIKLLVSNSIPTSVWSEPTGEVTIATAATGDPTITHYYPHRDTLANSSIALTTGLLISGKQFQHSRMKVQINRPKSTDTLAYKVYWTFKYPQNNPR